LTIFVPILSMKRIYFILNKCLHYLLALQVLNMSFGNLAMDEHVFSQPGIENNQIDSAVEFNTEGLLGWDNFIPEKHKAHQDNHFIKANTCFLFCERVSEDRNSLSWTRKLSHAVFVPGKLTEFSREINPPPPKLLESDPMVPAA